MKEHVPKRKRIGKMPIPEISPKQFVLLNEIRKVGARNLSGILALWEFPGTNAAFYKMADQLHGDGLIKKKARTGRHTEVTLTARGDRAHGQFMEFCRWALREGDEILQIGFDE